MLHCQRVSLQLSAETLAPGRPVIPLGISFQRCDQPCLGFLMLSRVFTSPDGTGRGIGLLCQFGTNHSHYIFHIHSPSIIQFRSTENKKCCIRKAVLMGTLSNQIVNCGLRRQIFASLQHEYCHYGQWGTPDSGGRLDIDGGILKAFWMFCRASLRYFIGSLRVQGYWWRSGGSGACMPSRTCPKNHQCLIETTSAVWNQYLRPNCELLCSLTLTKINMQLLYSWA